MELRDKGLCEPAPGLPSVLVRGSLCALDGSPKADAEGVDRARKEPGAAIERIVPPSYAFPQLMERWKQTTPARIGIGRAGTRYTTDAYLEFLLAHALAKDAVQGEVPAELIGRLGLVALESRAPTKEAFITNPELGRHLTDEAKKIVVEKCAKGAKLQVVVIDGLSSTAMEVNLEALLADLEGLAKSKGYAWGQPVFVRHGRLGVTNEIGELLSPEVIVSLVGERPGLVTAESLGAYLTYKPGLATTEAGRNLVSNIHKGGTDIPRAVQMIAELLEKIYSQKITGIKLKYRL
jgi:ethanolamine ammonia-lyase small subunit